MNRKFRIMCAAAALSLMVIPVSCGSTRNGTTSDGMNNNGIYDGSNGRNALNDAGDAIERGADRIQRGLDNLDDGMTDNYATSTTYYTTTTTTSTTRTPASMRSFFIIAEKTCQNKTDSAALYPDGYEKRSVRFFHRIIKKSAALPP